MELSNEHEENFFRRLVLGTNLPELTIVWVVLRGFVKTEDDKRKVQALAEKALGYNWSSANPPNGYQDTDVAPQQQPDELQSSDATYADDISPPETREQDMMQPTNQNTAQTILELSQSQPQNPTMAPPEASLQFMHVHQDASDPKERLNATDGADIDFDELRILEQKMESVKQSTAYTVPEFSQFPPQDVITTTVNPEAWHQPMHTLYDSSDSEQGLSVAASYAINFAELEKLTMYPGNQNTLHTDSESSQFQPQGRWPPPEMSSHVMAVHHDNVDPGTPASQAMDTEWGDPVVGETFGSLTPHQAPNQNV